MADRGGWNVTDRIGVGCTCIAVGVAAALSDWPGGVAGSLTGFGISMLGLGAIDAVKGTRR